VKTNRCPQDLLYVRADVIAECWEVSAALCRRLWVLTSKAHNAALAANPNHREGPEPDSYSNRLELIWDKLTLEEIQEIIDTEPK
jgi:hypothetical protein